MYFLDTDCDLYGVVEYDYEHSVDYSLFGMGISLLGLEGDIVYRIKNKDFLNIIASQHVINGLGPALVSKKFREAVERVAYGEVEFFKAELLCGSKSIEGFYVVNAPVRVNCCDMEKSEWKLTNFDPLNPEYMFYYRTVLAGAMGDANFVRCAQSNALVVSERVKKTCIDFNLKGIQFCTSIDLTPAERTTCFEIQ